MSMNVQMGHFGGQEPAEPYVVLDGVAFPLVPGSIVEGAPLNPFSPSNADGNTVAVVSQRHASEVWDDLTGGVGYLEDTPGSHQYAFGNLDTRVPGNWVAPHLPLNLAAAGSLPYTALSMPVRAEYLSDDAGNYCFLTWSRAKDAAALKVRRVVGGAVATVGIGDTEVHRGFAMWNGFWYFLTNTGAPSGKLYKSSGTPAAISFAAVVTAAKQYYGLVNFDNKLITYNATDNVFQQYDGAASFVAYVGGLTPLPGSETVRQLFVWTDKSGSRDALYCLTTRRILVYDEEGQQWEPLYYFGDLFMAGVVWAEVNRRDHSLVVTACMDVTVALAPPTGNILVFTPGTVDNTPINKGYGYPADTNIAGGILTPSVNYPGMLCSSIHWLYAFCYGPGGGGPGLTGGVFAYNEFGGWTQVLDPYVLSGTTRPCVGGGYGNNYLLMIISDGSYALVPDYDMNTKPPYGTYDNQSAGSANEYFVRSGRIYNKQKNVKKLGSHIEVTFAAPLPTGGIVGKGTAYLKWRFYNENGLSAWQQSALFPAGAQRTSVDLNDGAGSNGIQYYYMEWELHTYMSINSATPPVVESVVLYYTYFQTNRYAYSFNIDLTAETWDEFYPDGTFQGKSRAYLQNALLALPDQTHYHTFQYSQLFFTEAVSRVDMSLARRESSDDASGVYSVTVRDLEADAATGVFYAG